MSCDIISGNNISEVWQKIFCKLLNTSSHEISPLLVQIDIDLDGEQLENFKIREILDSYLLKKKDKSCLTVANTIFPYSLWNRNHSRKSLFKTYKMIWPIIKKCPPNYNGTYFQRMIDFNSIVDDRENVKNQLDHIITTWLRKNHRRSALQASIFDPRKDHGNNTVKGFPCLQQLAFNPMGRNGKNGLEIIAFYANQTIVEKAYGNYLGILNLGKFMAHEMQLRLAKITCISCVAKLTSTKNVGELKSLAKKLSCG